jgi:hypothetical protein
MTQEIQPIPGITPSIDYLIQYPVKSVLHMDEGEATWAIEFENGAIVANVDEALAPPPEQIVGLALLTAIYATGDTTLQFGRVDISSGQPTITDEIQIRLNPTKYTITDPRFEGTHYPQAAPEEPMPQVEAKQVELPPGDAENGSDAPEEVETPSDTPEAPEGSEDA